MQKRYPLSELGLFGSYARGDFNEKSDIDILVDFNSRIDAFEYICLAHELEDALNYKIELVSKQDIKPQYLPFVALRRATRLEPIWFNCDFIAF